MNVTQQMRYDITDLSDADIQCIVNCMFIAIKVTENPKAEYSLYGGTELKLAKGLLSEIRLGTGKFS